jgi:hypothetical protein
MGALEIVRSWLPPGIAPATYLSLWGCNPQAFYQRCLPLLSRRAICGVLDVDKPADDLDLPDRYARASGDILSPDACADRVLDLIAHRAPRNAMPRVTPDVPRTADIPQ